MKPQRRPEPGETVTCHETGKEFVVAQEGITFNYATDSDGNILSDEGVDIREKRALLDRTRPFSCYLDSEGNHVTGWKGNVLGDVISSSTVRLTRTSYIHGKSMLSVKVKDVHGGLWYGRGSPSIAITLRPYKG